MNTYVIKSDILEKMKAIIKERNVNIEGEVALRFYPTVFDQHVSFRDLVEH